MAKKVLQMTALISRFREKYFLRRSMLKLRGIKLSDSSNVLLNYMTPRHTEEDDESLILMNPITIDFAQRNSYNLLLPGTQNSLLNSKDSTIILERSAEGIRLEQELLLTDRNRSEYESMIKPLMQIMEKAGKSNESSFDQSCVQGMRMRTPREDQKENAPLGANSHQF